MQISVIAERATKLKAKKSTVKQRNVMRCCLQIFGTTQSNWWNGSSRSAKVEAAAKTVAAVERKKKTAEKKKRAELKGKERMLHRLGILV